MLLVAQQIENGQAIAVDNDRLAINEARSHGQRRDRLDDQRGSCNCVAAGCNGVTRKPHARGSFRIHVGKIIMAPPSPSPCCRNALKILKERSAAGSVALGSVARHSTPEGDATAESLGK